MRAVIMGVGLAVFTLSGVARADAAGDKALASVEVSLNKAKTLYFDYEVVNAEPGKPERKMELETRTKGDKLFSEFLAPADMKGTKLLVLASDQMYVYLPAFGKVRRIASNTKDQGFMGMSFSLGDLYRTHYTAQYTAVIASETPKEWKLTLTPKPAQTVDYAKIQMTVARDRAVPTELQYFDAAGKNVKTETRTNYTCEGDVCAPGERKLVDNTKTSWTKLVVKKRKVNESMSDDLFTKRNLGE